MGRARGWMALVLGPALLAGCGSGADSTPASASDATAAIGAVLAARGRAIAEHDRAAFAATGGSTLQFDRLAAVPWERWSYDVRQVEVVPPYSAPQVRVTATQRSRIAGIDAADAVTTVDLTMTQSADGWQVQTERGADRPALWEAGDLLAERVGAGIVIGIGPVHSAELRAVGSAESAAMAEVVDALGAAPPSGWVVMVPGTRALLTALLGRPAGSLDEVAALTMPAGADGRSGPDRVWVNREAMSGLSGAGRAVIMRHESTHVLTGAARSDGVPMWMEEGLAEYVGYRGTGLALSAAAGDLLAEVRAGRLPATLPALSRFDATAPPRRRSIAYQEALTVTLWLIDHLGEDVVRSIYRAVAQGQGDQSQRLAAALATAAVTENGLVTGWRKALAEWSTSGHRAL